MSRVSHSLLVLLSALAAGCAGTRDNLPTTTTETATFVAAAATAPTGQSAAAQPTVVDGNQLAQRELPICREILKSNSNVHVRQCMSAADWKRWERRQANQAEETVRMMQGSRYH